MSNRKAACIIATLGLACHLALADPALEAEMRRIEAEIVLVQQEQQTTFQGFHMTQEMRRAEQSTLDVPAVQGAAAMNLPPRNYEEMVRSEQDVRNRIGQYATDLKRLFARNTELEEQKRALRERLDALRQRPKD